MVGIWNHAKYKTLLLARSLHRDVSIVEDRGDDALDGRGDILDICKIEFAYMTIKEPLLFDIDDTFVGDNPDVEVIVDPDEKTKEPDKNKKRIFHKEDKVFDLGAQKRGKKEWKCYHASDDEKSEQNKEEKMSEDVEPVTMDHLMNFFVFPLASEMVAMKGV